jgi:hypothetical protein
MTTYSPRFLAHLAAPQAQPQLKIFTMPAAASATQR